MLVQLRIELAFGHSKQGLKSFALDVEITADNLVGDAGAFQTQRQRIRFRQPAQSGFVSIDAVSCHRVIIGDWRRAGPSNSLLAADRQARPRYQL
jgi:hypothetical protein